MTGTQREYRKVSTIAATASVAEAARTMNTEAVGCIVVVDADGRAVGMLTDRDLALRVVGRTCDPATVTVADVMTPEIVSVSPDDDFEAVVDRLKRRGVRRVPVIRDGEPIGMIELDDILQTLAREMHDLGTEARLRYRHSEDAARYDHLREGTEHHLEEIAHRLAFANWFVRKSFVEELDALRDRIRKAVGGD